MKTTLWLLVVLGLLAGSQAGKKMKKCKADLASALEAQSVLAKQLADITAENEKLKKVPEPTCVATPSLVGFWPLNAKYGGKNLVSGHSDFVMGNVAFGSEEGQWRSPPASFSTAVDSYAEVTGTGSIAVTRSFSWISAINRRTTTDGPLFEWDNGGNCLTHIWIWKNKLYINLFRTGCSWQNMFYSTTVANNKWQVFAVTYDGNTNTLSLYVDGKREDKQIQACASGMQDGNYLRINRRLTDGSNRRVDAEITCVGLFSEPLDYDTLYQSTIAKCKK